MLGEREPSPRNSRLPAMASVSYVIHVCQLGRRSFSGLRIAGVVPERKVKRWKGKLRGSKKYRALKVERRTLKRSEIKREARHRGASYRRGRRSGRSPDLRQINCVLAINDDTARKFLRCDSPKRDQIPFRIRNLVFASLILPLPKL